MTIERSALWGALAVGLLVAAAQPAAQAQSGGVRLALPPLERVTGQPPAPGSSVVRDDLAVLRWLQQNRTPELVADAWLLLDRNLALFSRALGVDLSKTAPATLAGLRPFLLEVDAASSQLKLQARRPRPYLSHPDLVPCLPRESGFSFPSGHSTWYAAAAEFLSALVPERRERLLQVGSHGGASRVMCGLHYPSDVEAGQRLGRAAAAQIQQSPQWQAFIANPAVQAELQAMKATPPTALPLLMR